MSQFTIRTATAADAEILFLLIGEMAAYERAPEKVRTSPERIREHLFGATPLATVFLGEEDGEPAGYAMIFPAYSSYAGVPNLYLEDIFLRERVRGRGYGKRFMSFLARYAKDNGYRHLCWGVLTWNSPSIDFYNRLGATRVTDHFHYDLGGKALEDLARLD